MEASRSKLANLLLYELVQRARFETEPPEHAFYRVLEPARGERTHLRLVSVGHGGAHPAQVDDPGGQDAADRAGWDPAGGDLGPEHRQHPDRELLRAVRGDLGGR